MAKALICFVLTIVFAFLSAQSFFSNDYRPLRQWLAYYQEYKALKKVMNSGSISRADLQEHLQKLASLYPGKAADFEQRLKAHYGNALEHSQNAQDLLSGTLQDTIDSFSKAADIDSIKEKTARHVQDKASEALSNAVEKPEEVQRNAEVSEREQPKERKDAKEHGDQETSRAETKR